MGIFAKKYNKNVSLLKLENNFDNFLINYKNIVDLLRSPEDYYLATKNFLTDQYKSGVVYVEFFTSITKFLHENNLANETLKSINVAIDEIGKETGLDSNVIVDINRGSRWDWDGNIALSYAQNNLENHVVGIGLGGDEKSKQIQVFEDTFAKAHTLGLKVTAHAGELTTSAYVWDTIKTLKPKRIGHGVKSIEDKDLLNYLRQSQIMVELCPISESITGATANLSNNPMRELINNEVLVTLGTDDDLLFDTSAIKEYDSAILYYNLSTKDLYKILIDSINYSFADINTKKMIIKNKINPFFAE